MDVCGEDDVLGVMLEVSKGLSAVDTAALKQTVRLAELSPARLIEVAQMDIFTKEELLLAGMQRGFSMRKWPDSLKMHTDRGATLNWPNASFKVLVQNPLRYAQGEFVFSGWKSLSAGFKCGLKVYPKGTHITKQPEQLAAFLEVAGPFDRIWTFQLQHYSIAVIGGNGKTCCQEERNKQFSNVKGTTGSDSGWNKGFLKCGDMVPQTGWLHNGNVLCVECRIQKEPDIFLL